jgi:uncharacterized protein (DUF2062 family)
MDPIIAHFQEQATYYIVGLVIAIPIIIVFRKWALPALLFTVETIIYLVGMHVIMAGVVRGGAWFKGETSMQAVRDRVAAPDWTTPIFEFWRKDLYQPEVIAYVELGLAVAIILAVLRYRPLRFKRRKRRKAEQVDPKKAEAIRKARQAAGRVGYGDKE